VFLFVKIATGYDFISIELKDALKVKREDWKLFQA
jgi:hypothetical protein